MNMVLMYTLIGLPPPPEAHAIKPAESRNLRAPWKNINTAAAADESSKTKQISQHYGDVHKLAYKGCSNTLKFKAVCRLQSCYCRLQHRKGREQGRRINRMNTRCKSLISWIYRWHFGNRQQMWWCVFLKCPWWGGFSLLVEEHKQQRVGRYFWLTVSVVAISPLVCT